jgi:acyl carrier protein
VRREQRRLAAQGEGIITPAQGIEVLAQLLGREEPQIAVIPIDWDKYLQGPGIFSPFFQALAPARVPSLENVPDRQMGFLQRLAETPEGEQPAVLLQQLRAVIGRVLRLSSTDGITARQGLRDVGLDSLMALEVRSHLETELQCALPATLLFDYPTLEALVRYLSQDVLMLGQPVTASLSSADAVPVEASGNVAHEDADAIAKTLASQLGMVWREVDE